VQESNPQLVTSSDTGSSLYVTNLNDALEKILAEHPGVDFQVIKCSDGNYVRFHRNVRHGNTSYSNFYLVKINGS